MNGVCAVWIIFFKNYEKPAHQIDSRAVGDLAHHALMWCSVRWLHQGHKTTRQIAGETGISRSSVGRIIHKNIQLKCLKKRRVQELTASNRASLVKHLISGEIILMRVSEPKTNTLSNFVAMCLSITVNFSWRLLFALLWLWTDWHMFHKVV